MLLIITKLSDTGMRVKTVALLCVLWRGRAEMSQESPDGLHRSRGLCGTDLQLCRSIEGYVSEQSTQAQKTKVEKREIGRTAA